MPRAGMLQEPPYSADLSRNPAGSHAFRRIAGLDRPLLSTSLLESQIVQLYVEDRAAPH